MKPKQHPAGALPRGVHKQLRHRTGMVYYSYKNQLPWQNGHKVKIRLYYYLHYTFTFPEATDFCYKYQRLEFRLCDFRLI